MGKIDLKGLEGLKGLSSEEYKQWREQNQELLKGKNFQYEDRLFRNQQFKNAFGDREDYDALKSLSPTDRDLLYKDALVEEAFTDKFGNDSNFKELNTLTTEGKINLLESPDYLPEEEFKESLLKESPAANVLKYAFPIQHLVTSTYREGKNSLEEQSRQRILDNIISNDNIRVEKEIEPLVGAIKKDISDKLSSGELTEDTINKEADSILRSSAIYQAHKDRTLDEYKTEDKIDVIAKYIALSSQLPTSEEGAMKTISILNTGIQRQVNEQQDFGTWVDNTTHQLFSSGVSQVMLTKLGYTMDALRVKASSPNATEADKIEYLNFLQGLDINGKPLPKEQNLQYWSDVFQYKTVNEDEINAIRNNGGITPYAWVTKPGKEFSTPAAILQESIGMGGLMAAQLGMDAILATASGGASLALKALKLPKVASASSKLFNGLRVVNSIQGESTMEAAMVGKETYDKARSENNDIIKEDIIDIINNNPNILNAINKETETIVEANPSLDREYIKSQVFNKYVDNLSRDENLPESLRQKKEELNRDVLTGAAAANARTYEIFALRNAFEHLTFQKYLFTKQSSTKWLNQEGLFVKSLKSNENGFEKLTGTAKAKAITKELSKVVVGGGTVEYVDGLTEGFGYGFGMNEYNYYKDLTLNPDNSAKSISGISRYLESAEAGIDEVFKEVVNPENFYEGLIGAISPVATVFPVVSTVKSVNKDFKSTNEDIEEFNKVYGKYKNEFKDMVASLNAIQKLDSYKKGQEGKTLFQIKNDRDKALYQVASMLDAFNSTGLSQENEEVRAATALLQDLSEGKFNSKEASDLLEEAYNTSGISSDDTAAKEELQKRVQSNASNLLDIMSNVSTSRQTLNRSTAYRLAPEETQKQILYNTVMDGIHTKRIDELSSELGIKSTAPKGTPRFGNKTELVTFIKNTTEAKADAEEALTQIEEVRKNIDTSTDEGKAVSTMMELQRSTIQEQIDLYESDLASANTLLESVKEQKGRYLNTVSADEILAMSPAEIAYYLNPENSSKFSKSQQAEIRKAQRILDEKNTNNDGSTTLSKVSDLSKLINIRDNNRKTLQKIKENPKSFALYSDLMERKQRSLISVAKINQEVEKLDNQFNSSTSLEQKLSVLKKAVTSGDPRVASKWFNSYKSTHPRLYKQISSLHKVLNLREDLKGVITRTSGGNKVVATNNIKAILPIIDSANTVEEAMALLEDYRASSNVDTTTSELIDRWLETLQELNYQRDAVKKKEVDDKIEEEAKKPKGKDYGWGEFEIGDTVYSEAGKKGIVAGFEKENIIKVQWGANKSVNGYRADREIQIFKTEEEAKEFYNKKHSENPPVADTAKLPVDEGLVDILGTGEGTIEGLPEGGVVAAPEEAGVNEVPAEPMFAPNEMGEGTKGKINEDTEVMQGNALYEYDLDELTGIRRNVTRRTPNEEGDTLSNFFSWLDNNPDGPIKLQDIIDRELSRILSKFPDTKLRFITTNTAVEPRLKNIYLLGIEVTPEIERMHDSSLGGIITANGKKYLVVGTLGFNGANEEQRKAFNFAKTLINNSSTPYFTKNSSERYFVDDKLHTKVKDVTSGRIQKSKDDNGAGIHTIEELLNGSNKKETNPDNLSYEDLGFMIIKGTGLELFPSNLKSYYAPDIDANVGSVFLMVRAANGSYIPIKINETYLSDINPDSELAERIEKICINLCNPNWDIRNRARKDLETYLYIDGESNKIVMADGVDSIKIIRNGVEYPSIKLSNVNKVLKTIKEANFRINVSKEILTDDERRRIYTEAGAFSTDVMSLQTANASYTVYKINSNGEPILSESNTSYTKPTPRNKRYPSARVGGKMYRVDGSNLYDENNNLIDTSTPSGLALYNSVLWNNIVNVERLQPVFVSKKGRKVYITGDNRAFVVDTKGNAYEINSNDVAQFIERKKEQSVIDTALGVNIGDYNVVSEVPFSLVDDIIPTADSTVEKQIGGATTDAELAEITKQPAKPQEITPTKPTNPVIEAQQKVIDEESFGVKNLDKSGKIITFDSIESNTEQLKQLMQVARSKGWKFRNNAQLLAVLESKGITFEGVTDFNDLLTNIKNCK